MLCKLKSPNLGDALFCAPSYITDLKIYIWFTWMLFMETQYVVLMHIMFVNTY